MQGRYTEWLLFAVVIVLDQISKSYITGNFLLGESLPIIPEIFHITYILNPGAAFGIFEHQREFFLVIEVLFLAVAAYFYPRWKNEGWKVRYGAGALLGGAVGNMIDRVQSGLVVDFFDFRIWPIFNIADIAIVMGVVALIYTILFEMEEEGEGGHV